MKTVRQIQEIINTAGILTILVMVTIIGINVEQLNTTQHNTVQEVDADAPESSYVVHPYKTVLNHDDSIVDNMLRSCKIHHYETDDTTYYEGEILLPDYIHSNALIVTKPKFINWAMKNYNIASYGDITDVLAQGTVSESKH